MSISLRFCDIGALCVSRITYDHLYIYIYIYIYITEISIYLLRKYLVCNLMTWYKCTSAKYVLIPSNIFKFYQCALQQRNEKFSSFEQLFDFCKFV